MNLTNTTDPFFDADRELAREIRMRDGRAQLCAINAMINGRRIDRPHVAKLKRAQAPWGDIQIEVGPMAAATLNAFHDPLSRAVSETQNPR